MSGEPEHGMGRQAALRMEYAIIALGILALLMIFQPFSLTLFTIGSMLVVLAGLINNLLPLAQPQVPLRSVITVAMVVAMIFCITLLVSIFAAYLYGVFFLKPPDPNTVAGKAMANAKPWYQHTFTLSVAAVAAVLAFGVYLRSRMSR
jgi:cytochrome c biogenesis factor